MKLTHNEIIVKGPKGTGKSCLLLCILKRLQEKDDRPHLLVVPNMNVSVLQ